MGRVDAVTVQQERPKDGARVLVLVAPWTDDWHPATAHHGPDGLRWRFDQAGWMDAHPADQWTHAVLAR